MRVVWVFLLMAVCLCAAGVALYNSYTPDADWTFYLLLGSLVLILLLLIPFYRMAVKPIRSLANGVDLLHGQDFSSRLAKVGQYEADRIVEMFNGMMAALKEERLRVREQNHFLDLLIGESPMGIIILGDKGIISTSNRAAALFLGYEEAKNLAALPLSDCNSQLGRVLARLDDDETMTVRLNNSMIYRCSRLSFMDKGYKHPFILIERLTEEVMKAEKKSYEKVIRVIAHEVNNTMGGIRSILDTVGEVISEQGVDSAMVEALDACEQRCGSLSEFITNFANVVKIPDANLQKADLNNVISARRVLLESMCVKQNVNFRLSLAQQPVEVNVDSVLFEQVLINIVKNAVESIGSDGEVMVTVSANPPSIVIADNGPGISEDAVEKLFSPFFSTKSNGQGIGLMFISEVLHKHGCRFSLETCDDGWTRFSIYF
ncbi:MAG: PAS domain-containing sensor histidine kinase [Bacteroides sp.]|nr:PAS domain-containing sensor histidine kinase [Bacteroides sp.]